MSALAALRARAGLRQPGLRQEAPAEEMAYWLWYAEGFSVESGGRRLGMVVRVLLGRDHDRPVAVVVAEGERRWVVPVSSVLCLDLVGRVVVLDPDGDGGPAAA